MISQSAPYPVPTIYPNRSERTAAQNHYSTTTGKRIASRIVDIENRVPGSELGSK
jgi:hypothetical protein